VAKVRFTWNGQQFMAGVMDEVQRRMLIVEAMTVEQYRAAVGRAYPPASLPGEFPRLRTGRLQRSIKANVNRVGQNRVQLAITNTAPYAGFLETGTSRMAARPHLRPIGVFARQNAKRIFGQGGRNRVF
jgi:HK97 gp10 family phage protein